MKKTDWLHLAYFASNLHRFAFCHKYLYQLPSGRWTPSRSKPRPKISGQASFQFFQGIIISWDFLNNDARIIFDIAHDKLSYSTKAEKLPACTNVFEIKCNFSSSAPSRDRSRTACEGSPGVSKNSPAKKRPWPRSVQKHRFWMIFYCLTFHFTCAYTLDQNEDFGHFDFISFLRF